VPVVAVLLAENVSVELPLPGAAIEAGLKLAVTPLASQWQWRRNRGVKTAADRWLDSRTCGATLGHNTLAGEALRARFGVWPEVTVKETVEVWVIPPPVACIVTVADPCCGTAWSEPEG